MYNYKTNLGLAFAALSSILFFKSYIFIKEPAKIVISSDSDLTLKDRNVKNDFNRKTSADAEIDEASDSNAQSKFDTNQFLSSITFSQWCIKALSSTCIAEEYLDKHAIKQLLPAIAPGLGFAEEYAYVSSAAEITEELLAKLPHSYFMKATHLGGGHGVILVQGDKVDCLKCRLCKLQTDKFLQPQIPLNALLRRICDNYIHHKFQGRGQKCQNKMPRKCIFEEHLEVGSGSEMLDYKVFVFHGRPMFIQIFSNRTGEMRVNFRSLSWVEINMHDDRGQRWLPQDRAKFSEKPPPFLSKLVQYSALVGKAFTHVRVDFFVFGNQFRFAEVTDFHNSCYFGMWPEITDYFFGYLIENPQVSVDPDYLLQLTNQTEFL